MRRIRTPSDLGALIRDRRLKLGLDQQALAHMAGVSRQWIVGVEQGKPRAEIALVLRTIAALGIRLAADDKAPTTPEDAAAAIDIDAIVAAARGKKA